MDADWIGSSPAVDLKHGRVYVGLEFGLFKKRGGIVCLDAQTGKKIWADYGHQAMTHASPLYLAGSDEVVIGSNEGGIYLYDGKSGEKKWTATTIGGADFDPLVHGGFGDGSIKMRPAYDKKTDLVFVGAIDGYLYALERKTGHIAWQHQCKFGIWSTPYVYKDRVYITALDKKVYCLDCQSGKLVWKKDIDGTRIFGSPVVINDRLYIGTNAARLHELDPETGDWLGYFQALERITNHVVYNRETDRYFLPTYANEIICLKRKV